MLDVARRDIIIVGAGGHARVLIGLLPRAAGQNVYAVDTRAALHGTALDDIPIIGGEDHDWHPRSSPKLLPFAEICPLPHPKFAAITLIDRVDATGCS